MKYYKIITDNEFIGVINSNNFVAENPTNGWLFTSTEDLGQYVTYENKLYRDYWMQPIPQSTVQFTVAQITEINEEEYNSLVEAIINNELIEVEQEDETPVSTEIIEEDPDITIEYVRNAKIKEMSTACRHTIEGGFDLELRGETCHFSLDTQDQLNLISLGAIAQTQSLIPYHADGQECTFYSAEEINEIVDTANSFKIYHTTYYNALKIYINALDTIEEISAIEYGVEIPEEYQTDVLKVLEQ